MKKRTLLALLAVVLAFALCACGGTSDGDGGQAAAPAGPPDLTGEWTDAGENPLQKATITSDTIKIWWSTDDVDALYWQGTFTAPTTADEPYTFTSNNDKDATSMALLASDRDTKDFTYENGQLSYEVSVQGVDMTLHLKKTADAAPTDTATDDKRNEEPTANGNKMDFGDYVVEVKGAKLAKDYDGNPAIVIDYAFTNASDETTSAFVALSDQAFQDGVSLESAIISDDSVYDSDLSWKDIRPGTTLDCQTAFILTSETSTVEVEFEEFANFSSKAPKLLVEFDPADLT